MILMVAEIPMEKRKPHYELKTIRKFFGSPSTRIITQTARRGAVSVGYMDEDDILLVINRLCQDHFYKSMTSYGDHKVWQDVYKYRDDNDTPLYIKVQLSLDRRKAVLIQMKRDEGGD
jgi:motility quorum-sensing regulator / GCU-specific mRNA interferase toxin